MTQFMSYGVPTDRCGLQLRLGIEKGFFREQGVERPRLKIMPVFALGRQPGSGEAPLTDEDLEGFDRSMLQCADARVVAAGGVYACPILAGLPGARSNRFNVCSQRKSGFRSPAFASAVGSPVLRSANSKR